MLLKCVQDGKKVQQEVHINEYRLAERPAVVTGSGVGSSSAMRIQQIDQPRDKMTSTHADVITSFTCTAKHNWSYKTDCVKFHSCSSAGQPYLCHRPSGCWGLYKAKPSNEFQVMMLPLNGQKGRPELSELRLLAFQNQLHASAAWDLPDNAPTVYLLESKAIYQVHDATADKAAGKAVCHDMSASHLANFLHTMSHPRAALPAAVNNSLLAPRLYSQPPASAQPLAIMSPDTEMSHSAPAFSSAFPRTAPASPESTTRAGECMLCSSFFQMQKKIRLCCQQDTCILAIGVLIWGASTHVCPQRKEACITGYTQHHLTSALTCRCPSL